MVSGGCSLKAHEMREDQKPREKRETKGGGEYSIRTQV